MKKIYLGIDKEYGEKIYITKHKWECGWYWGFGYLGNDRTHFHILSWFDKDDAYNIDNHLETEGRLISQKDWWKLGDLFKSAYTLKEVAEVYGRGGSHWTETGELGVNKDLEMAKRINKDLEKCLKDIWEYLENLNDLKGYNYGK